jgi:hypothetical protein
MAEASFASLSPTLLARKGGAKPAMRPQHAALASMPADQVQADPDRLEDLGWNDMGENDDQQTSAEVVHLIPATNAVTFAPSQPAVLSEREGIQQRIAAPAIRPRTKTDSANRAAFTLRLDTDRHLKLKLACTVRDCSAQALVTEALDALLGAMPELETIAAQVKRRN